jgi:histone acetyltransferase (RNA polymerase elongator complex component)
MLGERYQLVRALQTLSPTYIILYHIDLNTMRMIEVYTGTVGHAVRVYLLMHRQSTEEHRYLTSVRREQHAFEMLIRENAVIQFAKARHVKVMCSDIACPARIRHDTCTAGAQQTQQSKGGWRRRTRRATHTNYNCRHARIQQRTAIGVARARHRYCTSHT